MPASARRCAGSAHRSRSVRRGCGCTPRAPAGGNRSVRARVHSRGGRDWRRCTRRPARRCGRGTSANLVRRVRAMSARANGLVPDRPSTRCLRTRSTRRKLARRLRRPAAGPLREPHARAGTERCRSKERSQRGRQHLRRLANGGPAAPQLPGRRGIDRRWREHRTVCCGHSVGARRQSRVFERAVAGERIGSYAITVDATFSGSKGLRTALLSVSPGGICTCVFPRFDDVCLPIFHMWQRGVHFVTGVAHCRAQLTEVLDLVQSKRLHPEIVTTELIPWDQADRALAEPSTKPLVVRS